MDGGKQASFSAVTLFHGHRCLGTAIGFRVAEAAMRELSASKSGDEELVAIVENDSCSADAIQVVTGCTFGKGNLLFRDYGKYVYTFMKRGSTDAVRIALKNSVDPRQLDPSLDQLRIKIAAGSATPQEQREFRKRSDHLCDVVIQMPEDELLIVEHTQITEIPSKARIYRSVQCQECGQPVSEHRARMKNNKTVCIPCYERG